jgi:transposase-like protein
MEAVLRLLRGEALDALSRELGVAASTLASWKEAFLAAGQAGLKSREPDAKDAEIAGLKQLLGDREMRLEIHRQAAKLRGYELPFELGKRK